MSKKLTTIFLTVLITLTAYSPMLALNDDDDKSGVNSETIDADSSRTGSGQADLTSEAIKINTEKGEYNKDTKILARVSSDLSVPPKEMTYGEFLENYMHVGDKMDEVLNSPAVYHLIDKDASAQAGKPVFYSNDGTQKNYNTFKPENLTYEEWDIYRQAWNRVNEKTDGAIKTGDYPTTIIYVTKDDVEKVKGKPKPPTKAIPILDIPYEIPDYKNPNLGCDVGGGKKFIKTSTVNAGFEKLEGIYSVYAKVTPVIPVGIDTLPGDQYARWRATHRNQFIGPIKTAFGEYLDANRGTLASLRAMGKDGGVGDDSNYRKAWEAFAEGAKQALQQPLPDMSIQFIEDNMEGATTGGAFTYVIMTKTASVETNHKQDLYDEYECKSYQEKSRVLTTVSKERYESDPSRQHHIYTNKDGSKVYHFWEDGYRTKTRYEKVKTGIPIDGQYTEKDVIAIDGDSYTPYQSFQIVSVRCNLPGFDALVASTGSQVLQRGKASSTAKSPTVNGSIATFYNHLDKDFYFSGKSCDDIFGCTIEQNSSAPTSVQENVGRAGNFIDERYGAQAEDKVGSRFAFFRDNLPHKVRNDIWWLKPNEATPEVSWTTDKGADATYLIFDKQGTPTGEFLSIEDEYGNSILNGQDFESRWYTVLVGEKNVFNWRASWASEHGKPHRVNILYTYTPQITATVPSTFSTNGVTTTTRSKIIDMICVSKFNTTETSTPVVYNRPKPLEFSPLSTFINDENSYLTVEFVKSSAE